jgi:hypothetical protein
MHSYGHNKKKKSTRQLDQFIFFKSIFDVSSRYVCTQIAVNISVDTKAQHRFSLRREVWID